MMTTPADAIRDEVWELIEIQIEVFRTAIPPNVRRTHRVSQSRRENKAAWSRAGSNRQSRDSGAAIRDGSVALIKAVAAENPQPAVGPLGFIFRRGKKRTAAEETLSCPLGDNDFVSNQCARSHLVFGLYFVSFC